MIDHLWSWSTKKFTQKPIQRWWTFVWS